MGVGTADGCSCSTDGLSLTPDMALASHSHPLSGGTLLSEILLSRLAVSSSAYSCLWFPALHSIHQDMSIYFISSRNSLKFLVP